MCDVIAETLFSVRFHSCKKQLWKKILRNNMYEDNMYQSQEKLFDKSFDSDISKL